MDIRDEDLRLLLELYKSGDVNEAESAAFGDMWEKLTNGQPVLTIRQRAWANVVAKRIGVDPVDVGPDGPEDDSPEPTRLTSGAVPRGREVKLLVTDKPLRPPTRKP